jgi:outer membrane protein OmpA-like peptidoglycan-associated protein
MSDQADTPAAAGRRRAVVAVALALAALGAGVALLRPAPPPPAAEAASEAAALVATPDAVERIYFDAGAALPAHAAELLERIADAARAGDAALRIVGYYEAGRDEAGNAALAEERAQAVRHALEANGVAPTRLVVARPAAADSANPREGRRVEVLLQ